MFPGGGDPFLGDLVFNGHPVGQGSDLYRRLGYVTDIERSSGLKRDSAGDSASPNP